MGIIDLKHGVTIATILWVYIYIWDSIYSGYIITNNMGGNTGLSESGWPYLVYPRMEI